MGSLSWIVEMLETVKVVENVKLLLCGVWAGQVCCVAFEARRWVRLTRMGISTWVCWKVRILCRRR